MSITVSRNLNPVAGQSASVTLTPSAGNYVRVWCSAAPLGSSVQTRIDAEATERVLLHQGPSETPWEATFDLPGQYVLSLEELTVGATDYGGGYAGSPDSYSTETLLSTTAYSLTVGRRLTCRVGTSRDSATLVLHVWGSTVQATTLAVHGEASPALIDPTTPRAANAILATPVVAQLAALAGVAATTLAGSPSTVFNQIADEFIAHIVVSGIHNAVDSANTVVNSFYNPRVPDQMATSIGELQLRMRQHMTNDSGTGIGSASTDYHSMGDNENTLLTSPGDILSNVIALADCWRAYEGHRVQLGSVHSSADATNVCPALPPLLNLHRLILAELATRTPTAAPTANAGGVTLEALMGMS
jgi:hypothetical protein